MNEIILGLLTIKEMTSYEIRKTIKTTMSMISGDSMGSIHSSLKKLLEDKYINFKEIIDDNKFKKVYFILEEGKHYFNNWVNAKFEFNSKKIPDLKMIFFMNFADCKNHIERINILIDDIKKEKTSLEEIHNELVNNNYTYYQALTTIIMNRVYKK